MTIVDKWQSIFLLLHRDCDEKVCSRKNAAIFISVRATDVLDSDIHQANKFVQYHPAKEKVIKIVEAQMSIRSPDGMGVGSSRCRTTMSIMSPRAGKDGIHCFRCGGQGQTMSKCCTSASERPKQGSLLP